MDASLTALAAALRECLAIIGDEQSRTNPDRHTERLREVSEKIERLEHCLPPKIDPELRHFLQRRSYPRLWSFWKQPTDTFLGARAPLVPKLSLRSEGKRLVPAGIPRSN